MPGFWIVTVLPQPRRYCKAVSRAAGCLLRDSSDPNTHGDPAGPGREMVGATRSDLSSSRSASPEQAYAPFHVESGDLPDGGSISPVGRDPEAIARYSYGTTVRASFAEPDGSRANNSLARVKVRLSPADIVLDLKLYQYCTSFA